MSESHWSHLLEPPDGSKDERFQRVAWATATALLRVGPDRLQVADIARRAGVSRAWIYKYMGHDPQERLAFAVRLFGHAFAAPADGGVATDVDDWLTALAAGQRKGLADVLAAPWCVLVYVRYRHARHPLGDEIRLVEGVEIERFVERMPSSVRQDAHAARAFATAFHAARIGQLHQWLDPAYRALVGEDGAVAGLVAMAAVYAGRCSGEWRTGGPTTRD